MLFVDIISCRFSFVIWSFFQIPYLMQLKKSEKERMISFEFTRYRTSFLNSKPVCTDAVKSKWWDVFFRK